MATGPEKRITEGQFGFQSEYSTQDAIYVLRRQIETALAQRNGCLYVLAQYILSMLGLYIFMHVLVLDA